MKTTKTALIVTMILFPIVWALGFYVLCFKQLLNVYGDPLILNGGWPLWLIWSPFIVFVFWPKTYKDYCLMLAGFFVKLAPDNEVNSSQELYDRMLQQLQKMKDNVAKITEQMGLVEKELETEQDPAKRQEYGKLLAKMDRVRTAVEMMLTRHTKDCELLREVYGLTATTEQNLQHVASKLTDLQGSKGSGGVQDIIY